MTSYWLHLTELWHWKIYKNFTSTSFAWWIYYRFVLRKTKKDIQWKYFHEGLLLKNNEIIIFSLWVLFYLFVLYTCFNNMLKTNNFSPLLIHFLFTYNIGTYIKKRNLLLTANIWFRHFRWRVPEWNPHRSCMKDHLWVFVGNCLMPCFV